MRISSLFSLAKNSSLWSQVGIKEEMLKDKTWEENYFNNSDKMW
jgi:hypothetical protein